MNRQYDILILSGPPCSGKTTWASKEAVENNAYILSRDDIRTALFGKKYKQNSEDEKRVTEYFDKFLAKALLEGEKVILDNTHCKWKYIANIVDDYGFLQHRNVKIKRFFCPLWKLLWRNFWRGLFTGKKIPVKVIRTMNKNFKQTLNYYNDLVIE